MNKDDIAKQLLCRKKYLEILTAQIEANLETLRCTIKQYRAMEFPELKLLLPRAYQLQPEDFFLDKPFMKDAAERWAAAYTQSSYMPEGRTNITSQGLRVRSKGEVAIAEMLYRYDVPFRFEPELVIESYRFAPDFEIMRRRDGKIWFWEHCGLPYDEKYMKQHKWKLSMYEKAGIVPWDNLIVTYNDRQGNINMKIIEAEIKSKLI